jgi:hypothetical protein
METNSSSSNSQAQSPSGTPLARTSTSTSNSNSTTRFGGLQLPSLSFFQSPLSVLLEYSGVLSARSNRDHDTETETLIVNTPDSTPTTGTSDEVSIRIIGAGDNDSEEVGVAERVPVAPPSTGPAQENGLEDGGVSTDSSHQRYDIQQVARWVEQILPFSLLLLVVFIRQHLQGTLPHSPSSLYSIQCFSSSCVN